MSIKKFSRIIKNGIMLSLSVVILLPMHVFAEEMDIREWLAELDRAYKNHIEERGVDEMTLGQVRQLCRQYGYDADEYIAEHEEEIKWYGCGPLEDEIKKSEGKEDYTEIIDGVMYTHHFTYQNTRGQLCENVVAINPDTFEEYFSYGVKCCDGTMQCKYQGEMGKELALKFALNQEEDAFAFIDSDSDERCTDYYVDGALIGSSKLNPNESDRNDGLIFYDENGGVLDRPDYYEKEEDRKNYSDPSTIFWDKSQEYAATARGEDKNSTANLAYNYVVPNFVMDDTNVHISDELLNKIENAEIIGKTNSEMATFVNATREVGNEDVQISYGAQIISGQDEYESEVKEYILEYINQFREANNLKALEADSVVLSQYADSRAKEITYLFDKNHTRPDGTACNEDIPIGENMAKFSFGEGFGGVDAKKAAEVLFNSWLESNGHRENMLSDYASISIGVSVSKDGDMLSINAVTDFSVLGSDAFDTKYVDYDTSVRMPKFTYAVADGKLATAPIASNDDNKASDLDGMSGNDNNVSNAVENVNEATEGNLEDGYHDLGDGQWVVIENGVGVEYGHPGEKMWKQRIVGAIPNFGGQTPAYVQTNPNGGGGINVMFITADGMGSLQGIIITNNDTSHTNSRYVCITGAIHDEDGTWFVEIGGTDDPNGSGGLDLQAFDYQQSNGGMGYYDYGYQDPYSGVTENAY